MAVKDITRDMLGEEFLIVGEGADTDTLTGIVVDGKVVAAMEWWGDTIYTLEVPLEENRGKGYARILIGEVTSAYDKVTAHFVFEGCDQKFWEHMGFQRHENGRHMVWEYVDEEDDGDI